MHANERPLLVSGCALTVTLATSVALGLATAPQEIARLFDHLAPAWLILIVLGRLVSYVGYAWAYRPLMRVDGGPSLSLARTLGLVTLGFAAFAPGGGFTTDRQALTRMGRSKQESATRILALAALEYAVLAPLAWVCSLLLLGAPNVSPSLTLPWAIGVPAGTALTLVAMWLRGRVHVRWQAPRIVRHVFEGIELLFELVREARRRPSPWLGMLVYWCGELVALWSGLKVVGASIALDRLILAYATGYFLTPRTMPLAGVGIAEVLLTLSLHWVGIPLAQAVLAVFFYRVAVLLTSLPPATVARWLFPRFAGEPAPG